MASSSTSRTPAACLPSLLNSLATNKRELAGPCGDRRNRNISKAPMISRKSFERQKSRKQSGTFAMFPTAVLNSPAYKGLSMKAKALLLDMAASFNGYNNGDLGASINVLREWNWRSSETLAAAISELLAAGLIERTRHGGLHGPSLFAFTWLPINECGGKLDVAATNVASGLWKNPPGTAVKASRKTRCPVRLSKKSCSIFEKVEAA